MGKANLVDKMAKDTDYITPTRVLDPVRRYFGGPIPLDPAALVGNPTGAREFYYLPDKDGLALPWDDGVFVNPPYGKELKAWMAKIGAEAARKGDDPQPGRKGDILALLPVNRFEQDYFHDSILRRAVVACFIQSRIPFIRPSTGEVAKGNPYPSVLWGFNVDVRRFTAAFGGIGAVVRMERLPARRPEDVDAILGPLPEKTFTSKPGCPACGGAGQNSKGGQCFPCSMRETGVSTVTKPFFPTEVPVPEAPETPSVGPADPALEGFG